MFSRKMIMAVGACAMLATPASAFQPGSSNPATGIIPASSAGVIDVRHRPRHGPNHGKRRVHCHRDALNHRGYRRLHRHVGRRCAVRVLRPRFGKRHRDRRHNDFCVQIGPIRYCE